MKNNVLPFNAETKEVKFQFISSEEKQNSNGVPIGIIRGIASTFEKDRGDDIVMPQAFGETIMRHKEGNRPIRMLFQHWTDNIIGAFPIDRVEITSQGLQVEGEINLEVQRGRETYSLIKQGALSDLSIGFSVLDEEFKNGVRFINKLELWEISVVAEPMNVNANITEVKRAVPFQDLPLASEDRAWDSSAAIQRVRTFTDSEEVPSSRYRRAFLFFDAENADKFGAYKLPIADVIDGELKAVPRAIFAVASVLQGGRGGVDLPDNDRATIIRNVNRYYEKMGLESPLNKGYSEVNSVLTLDDVIDVKTIRDFETVLKKAKYGFSKKAAKHLAVLAKSNRWDAETDDEPEGCDDLQVKYGADFYKDFSKSVSKRED